MTDPNTSLKNTVHGTSMKRYTVDAVDEDPRGDYILYADHMYVVGVCFAEKTALADRLAEASTKIEDLMREIGMLKKQRQMKGGIV